MNLSEKIWRLREREHMSQEELAERLGVSRQTVSNWENGKAVLDAEKLASLCAVFDVSADDMLRGEGVPQPIDNRENKPAQGRDGKRLTAIIFACIALILLIVAAVGLIVCDERVSVSSLVTLHSDLIWIILFVLGGGALIAAIITFLKKK